MPESAGSVWKQQDLQLALEARSLDLRDLELFLREPAQIQIRAGEDLARIFDRVDRRVVLHEALDNRTQLGMLLGERSEPGRIGRDLRLRKQSSDFDESLAEPFELVHQRRIHGMRSGSGSKAGSPSPSAKPKSTLAASTIS